MNPLLFISSEIPGTEDSRSTGAARVRNMAETLVRFDLDVRWLPGGQVGESEALEIPSSAENSLEAKTGFPRWRKEDEREAMESEVLSTKRPVAVLTCGTGEPLDRAVDEAERWGVPLWIDSAGDHEERLVDPERAELWLRIFARLDYFSTGSKEFEDEALGCLGFIGRLNRHTAGREITCVIPDEDFCENLPESFRQWLRKPVFAPDREAALAENQGREDGVNRSPLNSLHELFLTHLEK